MVIINTGTFDLQMISVTLLMVSGTVNVHLEYARNSTASGCFLILSQGQYIGYFAIKKLSGRDDQTVQLEGLPRGEYIISGYDVIRNSPSNHFSPSVILDGIILKQGTAFWKQGKV